MEHLGARADVAQKPPRNGCIPSPRTLQQGPAIITSLNHRLFLVRGGVSRAGTRDLEPQALEETADHCLLLDKAGPEGSVRASAGDPGREGRGFSERTLLPGRPKWEGFSLLLPIQPPPH